MMFSDKSRLQAARTVKQAVLNIPLNPLQTPIVDTVSFKALPNKNAAAFSDCAMIENNPKWINAVKRYTPVEPKNNDIRTEFERDRNRIMHSEGFDRMRFKTQVFPVCDNDMVSTRSTHVLQVSDIARNISKKLGLNEDLTEKSTQLHKMQRARFFTSGNTPRWCWRRNGPSRRGAAPPGGRRRSRRWRCHSPGSPAASGRCPRRR